MTSAYLRPTQGLTQGPVLVNKSALHFSQSPFIVLWRCPCALSQPGPYLLPPERLVTAEEECRRSVLLQTQYPRKRCLQSPRTEAQHISLRQSNFESLADAVAVAKSSSSWVSLARS